MVRAIPEPEVAVMPFVDFFYLLRNYGILVGLKEVLDFYKGLEKGLAANLENLFLFARLVFVKRVEHLDRFQRAFALYFYNVDLPAVAEGDPELLHTKQFRQWLEQAVRRGDIPRHALWSMSAQELMRQFWERIREQMEAHHGGNKWVGTGGTSPFGHSGFSERGIRVHGQSSRGSALKVIGDRRYVHYEGEHSLKGENLRQALGALRNMVPVGPENDLDLANTIHRTCRNGGDIELVFERQKLDRLRLVVLVDNGGSSMMPHVPITQLLFSKLKDRFKECRTYYFHNTIYDVVYSDAPRRKPIPLQELLRLNRDTRLFIIGDASMAPEELLDHYGAIRFEAEDAVPSLQRLQTLADRFPFSVWLNPIPKAAWSGSFGSWTIQKIKAVFHMEDLTVNGIKQAVAYLQAQSINH